MGSVLIVGHGPSIRNNTLGPVIDTWQEVVRLKDARTDPVHLGTRTDYICSRSGEQKKPGIPYWLHPNCIDSERWALYWKKYGRRKPSMGLCAVFCAAELLAPDEIALIGFDNVLHPDRKHPTWPHDSKAEYAALHDLGIEIFDLAEERASGSI